MSRISSKNQEFIQRIILKFMRKFVQFFFLGMPIITPRCFSVISAWSSLQWLLNIIWSENLLFNCKWILLGDFLMMSSWITPEILHFHKRNIPTAVRMKACVIFYSIEKKNRTQSIGPSQNTLMPTCTMTNHS